MTTLLMMFLFPIGLYTYFFVEKRAKKEYQSVFDTFQKKIASDITLSRQEKIISFKQMLLQNDYEIKSVNESSVMGEKKVLSLAFIFIGLGLYIVGIFFYLAYFFWFQKPHKVEFCI